MIALLWFDLAGDYGRSTSKAILSGLHHCYVWIWVFRYTQGMGRHWIRNSIAAALCGMAAHSLLMLAKSWFGLLPEFQPYEALQTVLAQYIGSNIHPLLASALSFTSGATVIGFLFGRVYEFLPGKSGAAKGAVFGVLGWGLMGLLFFPLIGLGFFGTKIGLGSAPAIFSLVMLMTYSAVMGLVYAALSSQRFST